MNIVSSVNNWFAIKKSIHPSLGFVPTMGNIHEGHLSLCERAKKENKDVVVSIFVNPLQFNDPNDFLNYPSTLQEDINLLKQVDVDYLFLPTVDDMYPDGYELLIMETNIAKELEGKYRVGHFDGMLTIVLKLLNLIGPKRAYFGEKDFQQLLLVKKLVKNLFLPVEIVGCEIVREASGLAMSSRNSRLSPKNKKKAALLYQVLISGLSMEEMTRVLENADFKVEYIEKRWQRKLAAVQYNNVRLIDNIPE